MRAAHTLETFIQQKHPEHEITVIDTLKLINRLVDTVCCDGYYFMAVSYTHLDVYKRQE